MIAREDLQNDLKTCAPDTVLDERETGKFELAPGSTFILVPATGGLPPPLNRGPSSGSRQATTTSTASAQTTTVTTQTSTASAQTTQTSSYIVVDPKRLPSIIYIRYAICIDSTFTINMQKGNKVVTTKTSFFIS